LLSLAATPWAINRSHALWLMASALTVCPSICLLGAKRPQDKPWHLIVGTLWLVLALPGFQSLLLSRGPDVPIHGARSWFLLILVACGSCNLVFSRFAPCVLLGSLGQLMMLSPFLPAPVASSLGDTRWGLACYAAAVVLAAFWPARRGGSPLDLLWRDFRDAFGLVWAARVIERINATALASGWNVAAGWGGIRTRDGKQLAGELSPEQMRVVRQYLTNLLRRFVSQDWITRRLE
jgi:hypothetical protein